MKRRKVNQESKQEKKDQAELSREEQAKLAKIAIQKRMRTIMLSLCKPINTALNDMVNIAENWCDENKLDYSEIFSTYDDYYLCDIESNACFELRKMINDIREEYDVPLGDDEIKAKKSLAEPEMWTACWASSDIDGWHNCADAGCKHTTDQ